MELESISIRHADFDVGAEVEALSGAGTAGAVASFVGVVRGGGEQRDAVLAMTLEHYPGMTERALADIVVRARQRWALGGVRIIHRIGKLLPGERIVFVGVAGRHRHEAFAACEFIMDYLKTQAPFWKKEETAEGARWVDARDSDDAALARWQG
ncbi:molybdopterin synthase catalytic subunit MoaE [Uliginosibacterium sp. H3]|uniref:Molybdopterin synthase catalytic subunit n=1 Tax=Uliginosibacterium silvisoli TaxID=3114758 RepID=A0ABU6K727_9RHOO|nr:molybdopterin synthase catalytic subunit MoaE [Uliginosibacterium sp. H3]